MTRYCIVDVCGTLVKDDTTIGFLRWHFARHRRWRFHVLRAFTARWSPLRLLVAVFEKLSGRHLLKHALVHLLGGDRIADVEYSASAYVDWLLAQRRIGKVAALLEDAETRGQEIVLASASLEPVVAALAQKLGTRHVASALATDAGRHLGRYASDLTGRKLEALDGIMPAAWRQNAVMAISDNLTDRTLLESVEQAYVVLHKPGHRGRWGDLRAEYLFVC